MPGLPGDEAAAYHWLAEHCQFDHHARTRIKACASEWGASEIETVRALGLADSLIIATALAHAAQIPRLDAERTPLDPQFALRQDLDFFCRTECLAWHWAEGAPVFAVANPYTAEPAIRAALGPTQEFRLIVITRAELNAAMRVCFGPDILREAAEKLPRAAADLTAQGGVRPQQAFGLLALTGGIAAGLHANPGLSFAIASVASGVFFLGIMLFRVLLAVLSLVPRRPPKFGALQGAPQPAPCERHPFYTILVPLYREAEMLPHTIEALSRLNYPATRLEIFLILEETDTKTRAVCDRLQLDGRFTRICVPDSLPRTKPKACNYALAFARGDYIAIYDAEDQPDPEQLNEALHTLHRFPDAACAQAHLGFYNSDENWLTRQFTIEFSVWFNFMLPGLERMRLPIPLGGTSNHFRRKALDDALGWDAYNVTEDADIGIRLARQGQRVRTLPSATLEEANCELANWLHQRSRWLKGYLQTWLVAMRHPFRLMREVGPAGFLAIQLFVGGTVLAAYLHLIFWSLLFMQLFGFSAPIPPGWEGFLQQWTYTVLLAGNGAAILLGLLAAWHPRLVERKRATLALNAFSMPIYWFLISFAAIKALWSLVSRPFYWAKTRHGISRFDWKITTEFPPTENQFPILKPERSAQP